MSASTSPKERSGKGDLRQQTEQVGIPALSPAELGTSETCCKLVIVVAEREELLPPS